MATAPPLLSIEQYLHTSYSPDVHFVNGEIQERNVGEYEHARIQAILSALFIQNEKSWQIKTVVEQRIRVSTERVRICDIAVLRAAAPRESVTQTPPLLCIEILSPEDRLARAEQVLADYFGMGVTNIWLIDPLRRSAYTFDTNGLRVADPTSLAVAGTPIQVDLTEVFNSLD